MSKDMIVSYPLPDVSLTQAATNFSTAFPFKFCTGFAWVKLVSTGGSIAVSYQCAEKSEGPYTDPVDKDNAAVGVIVSSGTPMTASTRWISAATVMAPWIRIKFIEQNVGITTVTPVVFFQEGGN